MVNCMNKFVAKFKALGATVLKKIRAIPRFTSLHIKSFLGRRYPSHIDSIDTHLTPYERQSLYELAYNVSEGSHIVEIGSYIGASTSCIAAGLRQDSILHCVDTWQNDNMSADKKDVFPEFKKNTEKYDEQIIPHRGWSKEIASQFDKKVNLIFIDADHSWEGITGDLQAWLPFLKADGVLAMHDVGWGGCKRALEEIILPVASENLVKLPNFYAGRLDPEDIEIPSGDNDIE